MLPVLPSSFVLEPTPSSSIAKGFSFFPWLRGTGANGILETGSEQVGYCKLIHKGNAHLKTEEEEGVGETRGPRR